jgi:L-arabinose transport system substrate-binding protein
LTNAIANKAAGIVTCIPDQTMSKAVVDKLAEAKIPVVAADDALQSADGTKLAPWVGINAYVIGQANGAWLADYAKKNNLIGKSDVALLIMTMEHRIELRTPRRRYL